MADDACPVFSGCDSRCPTDTSVSSGYQYSQVLEEDRVFWRIHRAVKRSISNIDAYRLGKIRVVWVECPRSIPGGVTVAQRFLVPLVGVRISTGKHNGAALQPHCSFGPGTIHANFWVLTRTRGPVRVVACQKVIRHEVVPSLGSHPRCLSGGALCGIQPHFFFACYFASTAGIGSSVRITFHAKAGC